MGLVFEPERVGAGNIPATADGQVQRDAAVVLGESLLELVQATKPNAEILTYMLYGSAAITWRSTADRRSDVDLVAIVDDAPGSVETRQAMDERIKAVEAGYNVDVNHVIYQRRQLEEGRVNPFYANHLGMIRGLKGLPWHYEKNFYYYHEPEPRLQAIRALTKISPFVEAWPFALEYLQVRRANFQEQMDQVEPTLPALKGPFELPRSLGRTLGDLYDMYVCEHEPKAYDPDKDEIISPVKQNRPAWQNLMAVVEATDTFGSIGEDILSLQSLDTAYSHLLEATVAGQIPLAEYEKWLRSLYTEAFERAFKVVSLADTVVKRTVELAQLDPTYDQPPVVEVEMLVYPENLESEQELAELGYYAAQRVPVSYDMERLLFQIAPKYPDLARRYQERRASTY